MNRFRSRNRVDIVTKRMGMPVVFLGLVAALCLFAMPRSSEAQGLDSRQVTIRTNMPDAMVYADSIYLGRASERTFLVPFTTRSMRLVPESLDSWSMAPLTSDLQRASGDNPVLDMFFPYQYRVESIPFDASVFLETPGKRTLLGDTPLLYTVDDPIRGMLLVTKTGYEPLRLTPGEKIWNQHYVTLEPTADQVERKHTFWNPGDNSSRWVDYLAGGVAIASGIMAVRFKTKADRRYAVYENTGDPTLRPGFERYDTYAAVALGTMQVGLGVLAIRLVIN